MNLITTQWRTRKKRLRGRITPSPHTVHVYYNLSIFSKKNNGYRVFKIHIGQFNDIDKAEVVQTNLNNTPERVLQLIDGKKL